MFNNGDGNTQNIRFQAEFKANELEHALHDNLLHTNQRKVYQQIKVGWSFPSHGWVKCNVDGSVKHDTKSAACGGVFRDASGTWMLGFVRNLGTSSVVVAEL